MLRFLIGLIVGGLLSLGFGDQIRDFLEQQASSLQARTLHGPRVTISDAGMLDALITNGWSIETTAPFTLEDADGRSTYLWCTLVRSGGAPDVGAQRQVLVLVSGPPSAERTDITQLTPRSP